MDQSTRLLVINLTCFTSFILFWITFITTIMYTYCWSYIELWFETSNPITPYQLFTGLFGLIALWLVSELVITIKAKKFTLYKSSHYGICSLFLVMMAVFFINFSIHYKITKGEATPHDLLFKTDYFERFLNGNDERFEPITVSLSDGREYPKVPEWDDYLYQQTCGKGIDITSLSLKKTKQIKEKYQAHVQKLFEEAGFKPEEYLY